MGPRQSKPGPTVSSRDKAMLDLKVQRDRTKKYCKKMEIVIDRERDVAKALKRGGKTKQALLALRRKRYQEKLMGQAEDALIRLEELMASVEFAEVELRVKQSLEQGTRVLKDLQKEMTVEKVEDLMAETEEALEYQQEVEKLIAESLTDEDDLEVQRELDALVSEVEESQFPAVPSDPLPEINVEPDIEVEHRKKHTEKGKEKKVMEL